LNTVTKIWAPLRKLFALPGIPSWLRACERTFDWCGTQTT